MKKILSLVLVLSLVLGTFSFAFAATPEDVVDTDFEEAVETLMALGVVDGYPDGTYKPEKAVTRAEMAKLLIEALGYGELASGATATFADAQGHWAESYIGFAASMDIVKGYPDGTFKPNAVMSTDEAITMVVRALGYTDDSLKGTWPTNYKVKALDLDLTDGLTSLSGDGLRGNVALLLFNALEVPMVEVDSDGNAVKVDPEKLFIDNIGEKTDEYVKITYDLVFDEDDALSVADNINLEDYLYHSIKYYTTDDYDVAYVASVDTDEFVGTVVTNGAVTYVEDADDEVEKFDVTSQTALFFNGEQATTTEADSLAEDVTEVTVVYSTDENDKKVVEGVIAWTYQIKQIAYSTPYSVRTPLVLDRTIELPTMEDADDDEALDSENLTIEGDVDSLEDIKQDDIVYVYSSDDDTDYDTPVKTKLLVVRDTFEGKYTKTVDSNTFVIGGTTFDRSSDVASLSITLGNDYKLFLDKDGDIYSVTDATEDEVEATYGLLVNFVAGDVEDIENVKTVDAAPTMRVLTSGGDVVIYDLYTDGLVDDTTDFTTSGSDMLGDIQLTYDGSATTDGIVVSDAGISLGDLVKYELNSDGEVDKVYVTSADVSASTGLNYDSDEMLLDGSYDVIDSTVVFDKTATSWADWTVETDSILDSDFGGYYLVDDEDYFVEVVVVTGGAAAGTDDTYAVVVDSADVYDVDQDAQVVEYTLLVDGEEVTYLTDKDYTISATDTDDMLVKVTFDEDTGLITAIGSTETAENPSNLEVIDVYPATDRVRVTGGAVYTMQDDSEVYILETDGTDTVVSVGSLADVLEGDDVYLYETDGDDDGYIDTLILDLRTK
jgi:hypothetical protein